MCGSWGSVQFHWQRQQLAPTCADATHAVPGSNLRVPSRAALEVGVQTCDSQLGRCCGVRGSSSSINLQHVKQELHFQNGDEVLQALMHTEARAGGLLHKGRNPTITGRKLPCSCQRPRVCFCEDGDNVTLVCVSALGVTHVKPSAGNSS
jgi:hypothetical protein